MDMRPDTDAERIHDHASFDATGRTPPAAEPHDVDPAGDESLQAESLDASLLDAVERELAGDDVPEADPLPMRERAEAVATAEHAAATPADAAPVDLPATPDERPDAPEQPDTVLADGDPLTAEASPAGEPAQDVEAEAMVSAHAAAFTQAAHAGMPLEAVEFELALNAQDIVASGFEAAVRRAADMAEGSFLFHMPAHAVPDCQRVAAISVAGPDAPFTLLVLLRADGRSVRLEEAETSDNPLAGMAISYGGLLAHLKSLPTRAAA